MRAPYMPSPARASLFVSVLACAQALYVPCRAPIPEWVSAPLVSVFVQPAAGSSQALASGEPTAPMFVWSSCVLSSAPAPVWVLESVLGSVGVLEWVLGWVLAAAPPVRALEWALASASV